MLKFFGGNKDKDNKIPTLVSVVPKVDIDTVKRMFEKISNSETFVSQELIHEIRHFHKKIGINYSHDGLTILCLAVQMTKIHLSLEFKEFWRFLIVDLGADPHYINPHSGLSVTQYAAAAFNVNYIKYCIEEGILNKEDDYYGNSEGMLNAQHDYLFARYGDKDPETKTFFMNDDIEYLTACCHGFLGLMKSKRFEGYASRTFMKDGHICTPFQYACIGNQIAVVKYLVSVGNVDLTAPLISGQSPRSYCRDVGNLRICEIVLASVKTNGVESGLNRG